MDETFAIQITNEQVTLPVDEARFSRAVNEILQDAQVTSAEIGIAVVDDPAIQRLHAKFLQIDEPTDVMSFRLGCEDERLEGEIVVSADTALKVAADYGLEPTDELLLYVIHGMLHLVGFDDIDDDDQAVMRLQERKYLERLGIEQGGR